MLGLNLVSSDTGAYILGFLIILGCIFLLGLFVETNLWPLVQTASIRGVERLMNVYVSMGVTPPESMPPKPRLQTPVASRRSPPTKAAEGRQLATSQI
jgi:hypothetical protein